MRNFRNIRKQYFWYLLPAVVTQLAASLTTFVDSIVVANLLDNAALSVVSMGSGVIYFISTVNVLFGLGGATLYSESLGHHDRKQADEVLTASVLGAAALGIVFTVGGTLFSDELSLLIGAESGLEEALSDYLKVLCLAYLPIIMTMVFGNIFPAAGFPGFTTAVSVAANVLNLVFDFIYIGEFNMGVNGAAFATFTGYAVGLGGTLLFYLKKSDEIGKLRVGKEMLTKLLPAAAAGSAAAVTHVSCAIRAVFCNRMAAAFAGEEGIIALSVCMQTISMLGIFLSGAYSTMIPFLGVCQGMDDHKGSRYIIRISFFVVGAVSILLVILFEMFPQILTWMYAVTDLKTKELTLTAIRIFVTVLLTRWVVIGFRYVTAVLGMKTYALLISLAEGVVFVVAFSIMFCLIFGINGLWLGYSVASAFLLFLIILVNRQIVRKSGGKYAGFWLIADNNNVIADLTVDDDLREIEKVIEKIEKIIRTHGVRMADAMLTAICVEEMCTLTCENAKDKEPVRMDVLITKDDMKLMVDFRSAGVAFDPTMDEENRHYGSMWMLQKISEEMKYDYVLGMNTVRITLETRTE